MSVSGQARGPSMSIGGRAAPQCAASMSSERQMSIAGGQMSIGGREDEHHEHRARE